jgi:autotransporter translocation and assembly factor TamB
MGKCKFCLVRLRNGNSSLNTVWLSKLQNHNAWTKQNEQTDFEVPASQNISQQFKQDTNNLKSALKVDEQTHKCKVRVSLHFKCDAIYETNSYAN